MHNVASRRVIGGEYKIKQPVLGAPPDHRRANFSMAAPTVNEHLKAILITPAKCHANGHRREHWQVFHVARGGRMQEGDIERIRENFSSRSIPCELRGLKTAQAFIG